MVSVFALDRPTARQQAEQTTELCEKHGFQLFGAAARVIRSWAVARGGDAEAALKEMERAIKELVQIGATMFHPFHLWLMAEALTAAGQRPEALAAVEEAIAVSDAHGERFWRSELDRKRRELVDPRGR